MRNIICKMLLLLGVMAFAACTRVEVNPNYDPDTDEVKASFVMSISTAPATRQSSTTVQAGSSDPFRGIKDAYLLSVDQETNGKLLAADMTCDKLFDMSDAVSSGSINADNTRRVFEMSLPLKTNTLLFYGKAPSGQAATGYSVYDIYGHLDEYSISTVAGSALFQLGKRLQNTPEDANKVNKFKAMQGLISGILTLTMNTEMSIAKGTHPSIDIDAYHLDGTKSSFADGGYPAVKWIDYAKLSGNSPVETDHARYELENKLSRVYTQMTDIKSGAGEIRAASGEAILRTVQDLWTIVNEVQCATPFSAAEAVAKQFAMFVDERLSRYFKATVPTDGAPVTGIEYRPMATIIHEFTEELGKTPSVWPAEGEAKKPTPAQIASLSTYVGSMSLATFPQVFDIPRGASYINFDDQNKIFYYPTNFNTSGMGGIEQDQTTGYNAENYYYPAELMYFGNSPIRATDTEFRETQYPGGQDANGADNGKWTVASSWTAWGTGNYVKSSTRSVAMVNEINYGTALLQTQVAYGAAVLKDNNHAIQLSRDSSLGDNDEPDKEITVTANTFKLTGVIIGGVSQNVGWDYLPCKVDVGGTEKFVDGFVYDKHIPDAARNIPVTGYSAPNYTMVFDNFAGTLGTNGIWTKAEHQNKVYVALEFLNNSGTDFYGNHNVIRNGGYFYLIAELDPEKEGTSVAWPADGASDPMVHRIPPYNADGTSQKVQRVFIQDYVTKAVFTLGPNSLKYAYLTTPDLRSSSMTLGISVDLSWSTGIDFGATILGGN